MICEPQHANDDHEAHDRAETAATILLAACLLAFAMLIVSLLIGGFV